MELGCALASLGQVSLVSMSWLMYRHLAMALGEGYGWGRGVSLASLGTVLDTVVQSEMQSDVHSRERVEGQVVCWAGR